MTQLETLKTLETTLESFLEKIIHLKEKRLTILEGLNSLDDILTQSNNGLEITDEIGDWFASHNKWLTESKLKTGDVDRLSNMLSNIKSKIKSENRLSPADMKISSEIDRWDNQLKPASKKLTLIRKSENRYIQKEPEQDSISLFVSELSKLTALFMDYSGNKKHILSVLEDLLNSASIQKRKDTLILSGFIIYYLKQKGYKVEPYVKKLKEAETIIEKRMLDAKKR